MSVKYVHRNQILIGVAISKKIVECSLSIRNSRDTEPYSYKEDKSTCLVNIRYGFYEVMHNILALKEERNVIIQGPIEIIHIHIQSLISQKMHINLPFSTFYLKRLDSTKSS
jgi:hypothetical protein